MPAEKKPVQVSIDGNWVEYEGAAIEIPKPVDQMTPEDWTRMASAKNSVLRQIVIDNQSFIGLHVTLKDPLWMPLWLYDSRSSDRIPRAFDTMQRAINMGAQLISTLDDIMQAPGNYQLGADGHIHKDDVVLAKMPKVAYYAMQAQNIQRSMQAIEYQNVEGKAYE